jgi:protein SCO1/2
VLSRPFQLSRVISIAASRVNLVACVLWAVLMVQALAPAATVGESPPAFRSGVLEPARPAPDFALRTPDGGEFRLSRQRGNVVALSFGYTFCPDVCPTTLAELAAAKAKLGDDAKRFTVAFITVDPERDGPERLRTYTTAFDRAFVGLTGSSDQLVAVRQAYGVTARKRVVAGTSAAYLIDHSAFVYVVDPEGRLRLMFPFGTSIENMAHDIRLLMRR